MRKKIYALLTVVLLVLCGCGSNANVDESLLGNYIPVTGEMMGMALVDDNG